MVNQNGTSINNQNNCDSCKKDHFPENRQTIGSPVYHEISIGRGYDRTEYYYYQCLDCGSIWKMVVDSGAGGHGKYYVKIE